MDDKVLELLERLNGQINELRANMATKDDLNGMATKEDIKNLATKDDLKLLADELHTEIQAVYDEVEGLHRDFNTIEMMTAKNSFDIATLKAVRNS